MDNDIIGKECKFVLHLFKSKGEHPDTHIVKEVIHYKDGTTKPNLRIIKNFKKPFWITKPNYQNHKDKKEAEELDRTNKYYTTESDAYNEAAIRLNKGFLGNKTRMVVKDSPFTYGLDIAAKTYIKNGYMNKWKDLTSPNKVAVLDIEVNTITDTLIVISVSMEDKIYTIINKSMLTDTIANDDSLEKLNKDFIPKLEYLYNKYIPENTLAAKAKREFVIVDNELDCVKLAFKKLHEWKPDIATAWNMTYDIGKIVRILEKNNVNPKDIFSDPSVPDELKHFKFKEGASQKVTESGKFKPVSIEEQWHTYLAPAYFYWLDAMSSHRYIRVGGKTISGGYSLDNILKEELGSKLGKLKFKDGTAENLAGLEWHLHMVANRPLEYIIYNQWDVMSILELDNKTHDLSVVISMLSGVSDFGIFNSGPKRIIDAMHFFYLERGRVLATKPSVMPDNNLLGLSDWIVLMPSYRVKDVGKELIPGSGIHTNNRMYTYDSDQVSGYPSDGIAANVSKDTTLKEVKSIEGIPLDIFRIQNINLLFGKVNSVEYATTMFNAPTLRQLENMFLEEKNNTVA